MINEQPPTVAKRDLPQPNYVTFRYEGWKVTQTAPPTATNNPVWRITDPNGDLVAMLLFPSLEEGLIHLFLHSNRLMGIMDEISDLVEDA